MDIFTRQRKNEPAITQTTPSPRWWCTRPFLDHDLGVVNGKFEPRTNYSDAALANFNLIAGTSRAIAHECGVRNGIYTACGRRSLRLRDNRWILQERRLIS